MNAQVVLARLGGVLADGGLEELDVRRLVLGKLLETAVHPGLEAGLLEVLHGVVGQGAGIEGVLEVLESERELEHVDICRQRS